MGVLGLWQLLQPSSRPTKIQGLEGKKLAIDISIWLHQATKGVRNSNNGHISVLYNRICKLLYFKIKPVFVFDGPNVPKLKERVLRDRQKKRNEAAAKTKELDDRIQSNILESYALKKILGENASIEIPELKSLKSSNNERSKSSNDIDDDIFKLDRLPSEISKEEIEIDNDSISEVEDEAPAIYDINKIDKETMASLPPEIQIEILSSYKDSLKSTTVDSLEKFPEESKDFSDYQMKALLHKSEISNKISGLRDDMKKSYSMSNFDDVFHKKIASSQTQNEVILFTRKSRTQLNTGSCKAMELDNDDLEEENFEDNSIEYASQKEPSMKIGFSFNNKIELVPVQNEEIVEMKPKPEVILEEEEATIEDKPEIASKNIFDIINVSQEDMALQTQLMNQIESQNESKRLLHLKTEDLVKVKTKDMVKVSVPLDEDMIQSQLLNEIRNRTSAETEEVTIIETMDDDSDSDDDFVEINDNNTESAIVEINDNNTEPAIVEINDSNTEPAVVEKILSNDEVVENDENYKEIQEHLTTPDYQKVNSTSNSPNNGVDPKTVDLEAVENYSNYLTEERNQFIKERKNTERLSNSIENHVIEDAKHLLQLFGIPYLESPGEAEAQCAFLDSSGQTDGTITEDSDVWLFGAQRVYKSFFGQDPYIDSYSSEIIKSQLGFDRESLINVALFVGSDYTEGIESVGIVKTVEIFQEFEGDGIEKLKNFKKWYDDTLAIPGQKQPNKLRTQLAKLKIPKNFPSQIVVDAYLKPDVDTSTEEFTWSMPNLDMIRKYITSKLSWSQAKIDNDILPIIKRLNETTTQSSIENFFHYETTSAFNKQSKRMKNAISNLKRKNNQSQPSTSSSQQQATNSASINDDLNLSDEDLEVPVKQTKKQATKKQPTKSSIRITKASKPATNGRTKAKK